MPGAQGLRQARLSRPLPLEMQLLLAALPTQHPAVFRMGPALQAEHVSQVHTRRAWYDRHAGLAAGEWLACRALILARKVSPRAFLDTRKGEAAGEIGIEGTAIEAAVKARPARPGHQLAAGFAVLSAASSWAGGEGSALLDAHSTACLTACHLAPSCSCVLAQLAGPHAAHRLAPAWLTPAALVQGTPSLEELKLQYYRLLIQYHRCGPGCRLCLARQGLRWDAVASVWPEAGPRLDIACGGSASLPVAQGRAAASQRQQQAPLGCRRGSCSACAASAPALVTDRAPACAGTTRSTWTSAAACAPSSRRPALRRTRQRAVPR